MTEQSEQFGVMSVYTPYTMQVVDQRDDIRSMRKKTFIKEFLKCK